MGQDAPIDIRGFKGVNFREPPAMVQDDELVECINLDIGRAGELIKRTGLEVLHQGATLGNNSVRIIGHFLTNSFSRIIVQAGSNLYYTTDGASYTLIGAHSVEYGVQYADKFYMVRKASTVLQYDGTNVTALTGSPSGTFCTIYKDRLFVLNSEGTGTLNSRLYFSGVGDASSWPSTNFIDVKQGDGDFLTALAVIHDLLVVFKGRTSWALYVQGAPESWVLRNTNPEIGCISKHTPREIEGFLFFVGARGVYKTDGNIFEDISESIKPAFKDRIVNLTNANLDTAAWWDDRYILLLHPTPSTRRYLIYHLRTGGWTEWEFAGNNRPGTFLEVNTANPSKGLYAGDLEATGKVFRYGQSNAHQDAGVSYECRFLTKDFDFTLPSLMKRGKWMMHDFLGAGTVVLTQTCDGTQRRQDNITSLSRRAGHKSPGPGYFRTWQLKFSITSANEFKFFGSTIYLHRKRSVIRAAT